MATCTRCNGEGFLNLDQIPEIELTFFDGENEKILSWICKNENHDVQVCNCCGDGDDWYGEAGRHYTSDDPVGDHGPYAYNGGLCECH